MACQKPAILQTVSKAKLQLKDAGITAINLMPKILASIDARELHQDNVDFFFNLDKRNVPIDKFRKYNPLQRDFAEFHTVKKTGSHTGVEILLPSLDEDQYTYFHQGRSDFNKNYISTISKKTMPRKIPSMTDLKYLQDPVFCYLVNYIIKIGIAIRPNWEGQSEFKGSIFRYSYKTLENKIVIVPEGPHRDYGRIDDNRVALNYIFVLGTTSLTANSALIQRFEDVSDTEATHEYPSVTGTLYIMGDEAHHVTDALRDDNTNKAELARYSISGGLWLSDIADKTLY